jgi:hypothetical protein
MAMSIFPEAQRKAQEEIDRVIGTDRLPLMRDRDSLPYCEALFKETLRWQPIAPMGVPHRLIQDDTWDKYTLPKGSTLISNIWAMGHKEADAEDFRPERHLEPSHNDTSIVGEHQDGYIDPKEYVFGFGRRICPGKDLADAGVWLACITMVAAFKFGKKPDGKGGFIDIKVKYTPGIISWVFCLLLVSPYTYLPALPTILISLPRIPVSPIPTLVKSYENSITVACFISITTIIILAPLPPLPCSSSSNILDRNGSLTCIYLYSLLLST